jgi:hypothetical protein
MAGTLMASTAILGTATTLGPNNAGVIIFLVAFYAVVLGIGVLMIVSLWKIFEKANRPGWAAIIPIYNTYVMLEICGRPGWWLILMFIPFVSFVIAIILFMDLAKMFGQSGAFAIGLLFLPFIFFRFWGSGQLDISGMRAAVFR